MRISDWGADVCSSGRDVFPWGDGNDQVAGDALAIATDQNGWATDKADNEADDWASDAGNDTVWAGSGDNTVAGDAMAVADGAEGYAEAYTDNLGKDEGAAGNDEILTGWGNDIVAGDSQARASDTAIADADNKAILGDGSAGTDYIDVDSGFWNKVAGDAQANAGRAATPPGP